MNRQQANQLLDKVQDCQEFSFEQISAALFATGDLPYPVRSQGMAPEVQGQDGPVGESKNPDLVAGSKSRHIADSWPGWSKYLDYRNEQGVTT